jgi:hypothetical protein
MPGSSVTFDGAASIPTFQAIREVLSLAVQPRPIPSLPKSAMTAHTERTRIQKQKHYPSSQQHGNTAALQRDFLLLPNQTESVSNGRCLDNASSDSHGATMLQLLLGRDGAETVRCQLSDRGSSSHRRAEPPGAPIRGWCASRDQTCMGMEARLWCHGCPHAGTTGWAFTADPSWRAV